MADQLPPDYFERFVKEIEGIRKAIDHTNSLIPQQAADTAAKLADFYKQGYSDQASRGGRSRGASVGGDEREQEAGGYHRDRGSGSLSLRNVFRNDATGYLTPEHARMGTLEIPRSEGAKFTIADALNFSSDAFSSSAARSRNDRHREMLAQVQARAVASVQSDNSSASKYLSDEQHRDLNDALGNAPDDQHQDIIRQALQNSSYDFTNEVNAGNTGSRRAWAGRALAYAGQQAPKAQLIKQYLGQAGLKGFTEPSYLEQTGARMGVRADGGDVGIGGAGFRLPYMNAAAKAGLQREWGIQKDRLSPGINEQQARTIYDELNARGFSPGSDQSVSLGGRAWWTKGMDRFGTQGGQFMRQTPSFDEMKNAAKSMTKKYPGMIDSKYFDLMDKATRQGTTTLKDFNKTMELTAETAKDTGFSMDQLKADMDQLGESNQQQGGTHYQGQVDAQRWAAITKTSPQVLNQLMNNPLVQSYGTRNSGLLPWEQGLESGGERTTDTIDALTNMYNAMPNMPNKTITRDGISHTYKAKDRKLAQLSQNTGASVENLRQLIDDQNTIKARGKLSYETDWWAENVKSDNSPAELDPKNMRGYGSLRKQMKAAGFSSDEIASVDKISKKSPMPAVFTGHIKPETASDIAKKQQQKIQDIIAHKDTKIQEDNPNVITIKLEDKAKKKGFFLSNKERARAGEVQINKSFAGGATPSPSGIPGAQVFDPFKP